MVSLTSNLAIRIFGSLPFLDGTPSQEWIMRWLLATSGMTVFIFALYGMIPSRSKLYLCTIAVALLIATLLLAKTYGAPGINDLGRLPAFNVAVIPRWSAPVTAFFICVIASFGVHRFVTQKPKLKHWLYAVGLALAVGLAEVAINWRDGALVNPDLAWRSVETACLCAAGVVVLVWLRTQVSPTVIGALCCLIVGGELYSYAIQVPFQDRHDPFAEPPYVQFLKVQASHAPFRIFSSDGMMFPDTSSVFAVDDIRAIDGLYPDRYLSYVRNFLEPGVTDRFTGGPVGSTNRSRTCRE